METKSFKKLFLFLFIFLTTGFSLFAQDLSQKKVLFDAIFDDDYIALADILKNGADATFIDPKNKQTPLHWAAYKGNPKMVSLLISFGSSVDAKDKDGFTPLHMAAQKGHLEAVKVLLSHKADIEAKNKQSFTPLHLASYSGNLSVVKYLIDKGAIVDSHGKEGSTPLQISAQNQKLDVVKYLISKGADVNLIASDRGSSLHFAVHGGSPEVVEYLINQGAKVNLVNKTHATPFFWNGYIGNPKTAGVLLHYKADPSILNVKNYTALHAAAIRGNTELIDFLLNKHLYTAKEYSDIGAIPIDYAAFYGHKHSLEALISVSGGIDALDKNGKSALFYAIEGGKKELVQYMIETLNAKTNIEANNGDTPLSFAESLGDEEIVQILKKN